MTSWKGMLPNPSKKRFRTTEPPKRVIFQWHQHLVSNVLVQKWHQPGVRAKSIGQVLQSIPTIEDCMKWNYPPKKLCRRQLSITHTLHTITARVPMLHICGKDWSLVITGKSMQWAPAQFRPFLSLSPILAISKWTSNLSTMQQVYILEI